jgi:3-dehydroquinate synthase class II
MVQHLLLAPPQSANGMPTSPKLKSRPFGVLRNSIRAVVEDPGGHTSRLVSCQGGKRVLIFDE